MIKKRNRKYIPNIDKGTLCMVKTLAMHNRDKELASYLGDVVEYYIANARDTDYIKPEDTMLIDRKPYEVTCPYCEKTFSLDMEEIENVQVQD